jgi:REP element-mobilizing transposase RayT
VTNRRIPWFNDQTLAKIICRLMEDPACILDSTNLCWVVMPDHLHLLLQLGKSDLSVVVRQLKSRSALELNREIGRSGPFWFPGFHDHALRSEEDMKGVARYIVSNPLRAGLVKRVADYPYWNAVWL